ncbi:tetratricopeptide repeat protein [Anderseniella sp. Alg231-50]|uniref:tetratricopeptide repeat protein n=1 Tax=Anderseniella sp. Alg231-50 TaxID=1922226 RepID=UPI000D559C54
MNTGAMRILKTVFRDKRAVLFVDVVESTRLLDRFEHQTIAHIRSLRDQLEEQILPLHQGQFGNSLGDGFVLNFMTARAAVNAALEIQSLSTSMNKGLTVDQQLHLRMGLSASEVLIDEHDVYGREVMIGARLTTLAGPGEIVVTAPVREQLIAELDAEITDLGDCYLKHLSMPVRAYKICRSDGYPKLPLIDTLKPKLPALAIVPFTAGLVGEAHEVIGEVIADQIIRSFSHVSTFDVISRLSTAAFRNNTTTDPKEIGNVLSAEFVMSGSYNIANDQLITDVELAETKTGSVVWAERYRDTVHCVLDENPDLIDRIVGDISRAISVREVKRVKSQPLPTLESYSLLIAAISLMHRLSKVDFVLARDLLEELANRASRQSLPSAWMANWHVLKVQQGWSDSPVEEGSRALDLTKRALDIDPECSLSLTIDGMVHTNLLRELDAAEVRYEAALNANPNNSLAWLLKGTMHAFRGEGEVAVDNTGKALKLSPIDPHKYFYDSLAATAALAAHRYDDAMRLAKRSLRANRTHTSTLRVLSASLWRLGQFDEAEEIVALLMSLEPDLTVSDWLAKSPSQPYPIGQEWADVLVEVGVPK